jgi:hypothetical protein
VLGRDDLGEEPAGDQQLGRDAHTGEQLQNGRCHERDPTRQPRQAHGTSYEARELAQRATLGRSTNVVVHREASAFGIAAVTVIVAWCYQWRVEEHLEKFGSGPATARDVGGAIWHRRILHDPRIGVDRSAGHASRNRQATTMTEPNR